MQSEIEKVKNNISDLLDKIIDINNKKPEITLGRLSQLLNSLQQKISEDKFDYFVSEARNWLQQQNKAKIESYNLLCSALNHKIYQADIKKFSDLRATIEQALTVLANFANSDKKNIDKIKPKAKMALIFSELDLLINRGSGHIPCQNLRSESFCM